jgi:hypothetical protein
VYSCYNQFVCTQLATFILFYDAEFRIKSARIEADNVRYLICHVVYWLSASRHMKSRNRCYFSLQDSKQQLMGFFLITVALFPTPATSGKQPRFFLTNNRTNDSPVYVYVLLVMLPGLTASSQSVALSSRIIALQFILYWHMACAAVYRIMLVKASVS